MSFRSHAVRSVFGVRDLTGSSTPSRPEVRLSAVPYRPGFPNPEPRTPKSGTLAAIVVCLVVAATTMTGRAQEIFGAMFAPPSSGPSGHTSVAVRHFETADVDDQKARLDFTGAEWMFDYSVPGGSNSEWIASTKLAYYGIDTEAVLPDSGTPLPEDLYDIEVGAGYRRLLGPGRAAGLMLRTSSPSDKPFHSMDETVLDATLFYRMPARNRDSWMFFLNYGNRRSFLNNIPLPGIAYAYLPSRDTFALIGLPVAMLRTRFREDWSLELFYFPPIRGRVELGYDLTPGLRPYLRFRSYRDAFLLAGREDADEWLRHQIIQGDAGLEWTLGERAALDLGFGYAFDRYIYVSDSFSDNDNDRLDLDEGIAYQLRFTYRL